MKTFSTEQREWLEIQIGKYDVLFKADDYVMVADIDGRAYEVYEMKGKLYYNKA